LKTSETERDESEHNISSRSSPFDYAVSYWLKHAMDVPHGRHSTALSEVLWGRVRDFFWDQDGAIFVKWLRAVPPTLGVWHMKEGSVKCLGTEGTKKPITSGLHVAASYDYSIFADGHTPTGLIST
jgi:hypothetical protein